MNLFKTSLAAIAFAFGGASSVAQAASLSTDVTVNLVSSLSLVCFDEVDVNISSDTFISALARNGTREMPSRTRNARAREGRFIVNAGRRQWNRNRYKFRRRVNLDLHNVCAYYAYGGLGGARVTVDPLEDRMEAVGGSYIQVQRVRTRDNDNAGAWRRGYRIPSAQLGHGVVRGIDVRLRLDLLNAKEPGTYSSLTDGTFMVTVTPNP